MRRAITVGFVLSLVTVVGLFAWDVSFVRNSVETTGTVIDRRSDTDKRGDYEIVKYEHPVDGYTYRAPVGTRAEIGEQIDLRVHEEYRTSVREDNTRSLYGDALVVLVFIFLGGVFAGMLWVREQV